MHVYFLLMTVRAQIESGRILDIPTRLPIAGESIIDGIRSEVVIIDRNSARVEHFRDGDFKIVCGKDPILHREEITESETEVVLASGSGGEITGKLIWQKDRLVDQVIDRVEAIRRELGSISQG